MKLKIVPVLMILLLFTSAFLSGCGPKKPVAAQEVSAISVEAVKATKTDIKTQYNASGEIEAEAEAKIASKVAGRVTDVYIKLGDKVQKGQALFRIDDRDARNQVTQLQAALDIAKSGYDSAAQTFNDAQSNYNRYDSLYKESAVSKIEFEQASTRLANAKIGLRQAQNSINQAKASLNSAQQNLNDYNVTAPIGGFVGAVGIETGEMVSSQTEAATIVQIDKVKVKVSIPESIINSISKGSKVSVQIKSLGKTGEGMVSAVSPQADTRTLGYPAEIELVNSSGEIKPGMSADINLATGSVKNVLTVPLDAVIEQDGQQIVFVVENNKAKEVVVQTGVSNDTQIQIAQGIKEGQTVVVKGNHLLSDGQIVKIVKGQGGENN